MLKHRDEWTEFPDERRWRPKRSQTAVYRNRVLPFDGTRFS